MNSQDKINAAITISMLMEQLKSEEDLIRMAWEYEKDFPWVWNKLYSLIEAGLSSDVDDYMEKEFEEIDIYDLMPEFSYYEIDVSQTKFDRVNKYLRKYGNPKKRRSRWNHKFRYGAKGDSTRTFRKSSFEEVIPGGEYDVDLKVYVQPNGKWVYEISFEEAMFLEGIYKDSYSRKFRYRYDNEELKKKDFKRYRNLIFLLEDPKIFVKTKISKQYNSCSKHALRKRRETGLRRDIKEPLSKTEVTLMRERTMKSNPIVLEGNSSFEVSLAEVVEFDFYKIIYNMDGRIESAHYDADGITSTPLVHFEEDGKAVFYEIAKDENFLDSMFPEREEVEEDPVMEIFECCCREVPCCATECTPNSEKIRDYSFGDKLSQVPKEVFEWVFGE
ncbi:MAG: hypothetical protein KC516_02085 [Nanoarchaeota archaeon]|nr:hypothetical protein [Nanoarchaeota archaeon]